MGYEGVKKCTNLLGAQKFPIDFNKKKQWNHAHD